MDIDLNYIGALNREEMVTDRPKTEQAAQAVFSREGFSIKRVPDEHAGGKWRLSYQSFTGQSGNLEVDLNFMFRQPLWDIRGQRAQPSRMHSDPGGTASKGRIGSDVGRGVSGREDGENDKTPRGSTHGVLR